MKIKRILITIIIVIISIAISSCTLLPKEDEKLSPPIIKEKVTEYKTEPVKYGTVKKDVTAFGSFKPVNEVAYHLENLGGTFLQYYFKVNDDIKKGDVIAELYTGDLDKRIRDMEISMEKARLSFERSTKQYNENKIDKYDYEIAKLNFQKVENLYNDLLTEKKNSQIISKDDGTISYLASLEEGDGVAKGNLIFKMILNHQMRLTCKGSNIYKFDKDKKVTIESKSETTMGTIVEKNSRTMEVKPDKVFDDWQIGTSVMIAQNLDTVEDVLMVNQKAILKFGLKTYAKILVDGIPMEKEVVLGVTNGRYYEVISGLSEGDEAIVY